jgi:uncharacterized damage-inducible protein DinB
MSELGHTLIEDARKRLVEAYPAQVREALGALDEDQIWRQANPGANSVGNLVLHLIGSTRHFLGRGVGESDYVRDRPSEFAEESKVPREALLKHLDEMVEETRRVLGALNDEGLLEKSDGAGAPATMFEATNRRNTGSIPRFGNEDLAEKIRQGRGLTFTTGS